MGFGNMTQVFNMAWKLLGKRYRVAFPETRPWHRSAWIKPTKGHVSDLSCSPGGRFMGHFMGHALPINPFSQAFGSFHHLCILNYNWSNQAHEGTNCYRLRQHHLLTSGHKWPKGIPHKNNPIRLYQVTCISCSSLPLPALSVKPTAIHYF